MKLNEKTYIWFLTEKDATDQLKKKTFQNLQMLSRHRRSQRPPDANPDSFVYFKTDINTADE